MRPVCFAWLAGCLPSGGLVRTGATVGLEALDVGRDPALLTAGKTCDADDSLWTFFATTDAWTAGGWVWLTDDGLYVESHRIPSVAAARDGSADELELELPVAVDWRDDTGTAFSCGARPSGQLFVLGLDGVLTDCRSWGDAALFDEVTGAAPDCSTPL